MSEAAPFDFIVLGGGPAGQKAAIQAAKAGRSVLMVDREAAVGGECVNRGTIPSKTLRESAVYLRGLATRAAEVLPADLDPGIAEVVEGRWDADEGGEDGDVHRSAVCGGGGEGARKSGGLRRPLVQLPVACDEGSASHLSSSSRGGP